MEIGSLQLFHPFFGVVDCVGNSQQFILKLAFFDRESFLNNRSTCVPVVQELSIQSHAVLFLPGTTDGGEEGIPLF